MCENKNKTGRKSHGSCCWYGASKNKILANKQLHTHVSYWTNHYSYVYVCLLCLPVPLESHQASRCDVASQLYASIFFIRSIGSSPYLSAFVAIGKALALYYIFFVPSLSGLLLIFLNNTKCVHIYIFYILLYRRDV